LREIYLGVILLALLARHKKQNGQQVISLPAFRFSLYEFFTPPLAFEIHHPDGRGLHRFVTVGFAEAQHIHRAHADANAAADALVVGSERVLASCHPC